MFDLTSSKLLILGVVALIVVGPKELPFLLRTIGKYVGMIRRQANEFRSQFDEAMREAELDSIRKDVENVARDAENTLRDAGSSVDREIDASKSAVDQSLNSTSAAESHTTEAHTTTSDPVHTFDPLNGLDTGPDQAPSPPAASKTATIEHLSLPDPIDVHAKVPALVPASAPALAKTGT
jgi:sec-independent protein translocase protein TatB